MADNEGTAQIPVVESPKPSRSLVDWFAVNPRVGLIGTMASVIGIPLTLILFFITQKEREIRYVSSASPTTIVKTGQSSSLRVYYEGKELTADVTSIQIALWNAGRESVKRENILSKTITLKFDPPSNIFEARVKNVTRSIVNFQLDVSERAKGILKCSWDVFEPGDGALLELIYAGSGANIVSDGVIEGQHPIREGALPGKAVIYLSTMQKVLLLLMCVLTGLIVAIRGYRSAKKLGDSIAIGLLSSVVSGAVMLVLILVIDALQSHSVPFAF